MTLRTKDNLFKSSGRTSAEEKAKQTTSAAQAIIDTETSAREQKTARLKALRLEKEAAESAQEQPAPRARKRTVRKA